MSATTPESRLAYGRAAVIASCARRRRAAATSFIALVIFCVFLTDAMRVRMAFSEGMLRLRRRRRLAARAAGRGELLVVLGERRLHELGELVERLAVGALAADGVEHVGAARLHPRIELALP